MFHNTPLVLLSLKWNYSSLFFLMHDDNVSHIYIAKEILSCQCATRKNIYSRFLGMIVVFLQFVFSISQPKNVHKVPSGACFFVWQKFPCISCVTWSPNIIKDGSRSVMHSSSRLFSKPTADCCSNFLFKFPFLSKKSSISTFPPSSLIISAPLQLWLKSLLDPGQCVNTS